MEPDRVRDGSRANTLRHGEVMQRSARWSHGSRCWTVAIITSLALLALLAPLGAAQTLPAPLPQLPVAPPSVPALPPIQPPAPVAPVAPAPLPAPALPPLPPPVSPALPAPNLLAPLTLEPAPLPLAPAAGGHRAPTAIANEGTDTRATAFERSSAAAVSAASELRLKQTRSVSPAGSAAVAGTPRSRGPSSDACGPDSSSTGAVPGSWDLASGGS